MRRVCTANKERNFQSMVCSCARSRKLKDITVFAKEALETSAKIGVPKGLGGVADAIEKPEYAAAVGLALMAAKESGQAAVHGGKSSKTKKSGGGFFSKIFKKF